ncbi:LOW QUALITY PROTEIN: transmembrane protein 33-like [Paramacrobiotus metropolitanus]|uniref:LOW QUALITY PROTEIN: transmembrane protein 33-like n=1 Tax=Paramacrobiotus metropolitanus TaxID=2943436 RepID=UPI00244636F3|nr:LOW QUALITY PROTEIN: transmembrane protein 33-like [Paramacrobiotus metropolitanus]
MADTDRTPPASNAQDAPPTYPGRRSGLMAIVSERPIDFLLNLTRLSVVIFSILYLTTLGGNDAYYKALLAMAASSALRLYQRTREPGNRGAERTYAQLFQTLLIEDSCHYLMYCVLFVIGSPVTFVLMPIAIFACIHSMAFFVKLGNEIGAGAALLRPVGRLIETEQQRMLMTAALGEILMMPVSVIMVFTGKVLLLAPIMYYRFLQLRYRSRRNPYCRQAFFQLRLAAERLAMRSPAAISNIILKCVGFISQLAPQIPAQ